MSTSSLSEGSGYYTGGPGPHQGSGTSAGVRAPREVRSPGCLGWALAFPGTCGVPGPFPVVRQVRGRCREKQDSGPQGSGCLDVAKGNYKALA